MPHPRPAAPPDALSSTLRATTGEIHREAEGRPFMRELFAGRLTRDAYADWLARQWHVYATLEERLAALPADEPAARVVPTHLHRRDRLAADLEHLTDGRWRPGGPCTPATRAYVQQIERCDDSAPGLVAHAWLRYLGNVGGRDVLRRLARSITGAPEGDDRGLAFTAYDDVDDVRTFFRSFHSSLDALVLAPDERERAVAEATAGFRHNITLTDELARDHAIAP